MPITDTLSIYTYDWSREESYGRVANELADGLEALGCYVNRIGPHAPRTKPLRIALGGIALGYPTSIEKIGQLFAAGPQVWITTFESDHLPFLWADILNQTAKAVIVPSQWSERVFKESGVERPVRCIPQGISPAFIPIERVRDEKAPYVFMALADRDIRKSWDKAGFAFVQAFGDDPNYRLILKARERNTPIEVVNPNIQYLQADLDDAQMMGLYARTDCFLSPGREGYGLCAREFAATGGISLALNWGGTADDLHRWGLPIATKGMETAWKGHPTLEGVGQWAAVDVEDMARTMKHVAANRDYYRQWARHASSFARENYTWKRYAEQVYAVWKEACSGERTLRAAV